MDWQPIESAPKDGTVILVYADQGKPWNGVHAARWREEQIWNGYQHRWCHAAYQNLGDGVSGYVTHWMPLPDLPA